MRTLIWFIYFWLYMVACLPASLWMDHLENTGQIEKLDFHVERFVKNWARRLLRLAGAKIIVTGQENMPEGAAVVIANHQGNFDIPIMLSLVGRPRGLIAKKELSRLPGVSTWMRHLHCLFVDRSNPRAGAETILEGSKLLESGHGLTVFPEGTRSRGGPVKPFKAGAFRIATRAGAPIVPVTIDGSHQLMEAHHGWFIHPATVYVTIHKPVETKNLSREQIRELPEKTREIILSAMKGESV